MEASAWAAVFAGNVLSTLWPSGLDCTILIIPREPSPAKLILDGSPLWLTLWKGSISSVGF